MGTEMRAAAFVCALFFPALVSAQQYLPQIDLTTCRQRSAQQCQALGCDGRKTIYWWDCAALTDGAAAVVIDPTRQDFAAVHPKGMGLTAAEQAALQTRTQLGTKLPDIIPGAMFRSRFTAAQTTAITNAVKSDATLNTEYNAIKAAAQVDLQDPAVIDFVKRLNAAAILSSADVQTVTATQ